MKVWLLGTQSVVMWGLESFLCCAHGVIYSLIFQDVDRSLLKNPAWALAHDPRILVQDSPLQFDSVMSFGLSRKAFSSTVSSYRQSIWDLDEPLWKEALWPIVSPIFDDICIPPVQWCSLLPAEPYMLVGKIECSHLPMGPNPRTLTYFLDAVLPRPLDDRISSVHILNWFCSHERC